jgi:hypothetical protein
MGTPHTRIRSRLGALALATVLLITGAVSAGAAHAADPQLLWKKCPFGEGAGECYIPRGVVADPATGNVVVADQSRSRISEFTPWGQFLRSWGWGVANGNAELQVCGPQASPPTLSCQPGIEGSGPGQLDAPEGVALDSSGNVYVVDHNNYRVQKFDDEGHFLLMFGSGVNQGGGAPSNPGNLCTSTDLANGDTCGAGTTGVGAGEFSGKWPYKSYIAIGSDDTIYVGDEDRIQKFDTGGNTLGQIALPEKGVVGALAFDDVTKSLYFAYASTSPGYPLDEYAQPNVYRLDLSSGNVVGKGLPVGKPDAIAVDDVGHVYVFDASANNGGGVSHPRRILEFDEAGNLTATLLSNSSIVVESTGLATSSACGIPGTELFATNYGQADFFGPPEDSVSVFGPPPNPAVCPPPAAAPSIEETYAISVDFSDATVRAAVNPHFWPDTRYRVQYGTGKCSEGGCTQERPAPPGSLLTSQVLDRAVDTANVLLQDLVPDTTYHYRFVAQSSGGGPTTGPERSFHTAAAPVPPPSSDPCPNSVFRGGASTRLPDCRAYELVSPLAKNNGDVATFQRSVTFNQTSSDGSRASFASPYSFPGSESSAFSTQYLAQRDPASGWSTVSLAPPRSSLSLYETGYGGDAGAVKAMSDDLCSAWVLQESAVSLTPDAPPGVPNLYRRDYCGAGDIRLLTSEAPPGYGPGLETSPPFSSYFPELQGFSADSSRSVIRANAALTPNAAGKKGLYQVYVAYGDDKLRLVSVLPNGKAATTHSSVGTPSRPGGELSVRASSVHHAVSADGSRVFWSASDSQEVRIPYPSTPGRLFLRLNATEAQSKVSGGTCTEAAKACTVEISSDSSARFFSADPQSERALYLVGDLENQETELFEFNLASASSHLISKEVAGVMGASEDTRDVYFVSREVLTGGQQNSEGNQAIAGRANLYLYRATAGGGEGTYTFVATVANSDGISISTGFDPQSITASNPELRVARVSPDGETAAFTSPEPLTGYDNTDASTKQRDGEVFLYDAGTGPSGALVCASCNPGGARPAGRQGLRRETRFAAYVPGWQSQYRPTRALSNDGTRLFFNSFGALLSRDTNGKEDVYEWEAPGAGSCSDESSAYSIANEGCIYLISSGESPEDSEFFDATPSGSDVFFSTQSSLLQQDYGLVDVYDARVNGGFPPPVAAPPACEGEACQGPLAPPNDPTPASSSFEGAGNVVEKPAKKKARKKRHAKKHQSRKKHSKRAGADGRAGR